MGVRAEPAGQQVCEPPCVEGQGQCVNNQCFCRNPFRGYTSIGSIGRLKQSDRIVLRLKPAVFHEYPRLLREATYQSFSRNMWLSGGKSFNALEPVAQGTEWQAKARGRIPTGISPWRTRPSRHHCGQ